MTQDDAIGPVSETIPGLAKELFHFEGEWIDIAGPPPVCLISYLECDACFAVFIIPKTSRTILVPDAPVEVAQTIQAPAECPMCQSAKGFVVRM